MKYKKIYFVGIKGVGVATLAIIAKQAGFAVVGCDIADIFITDEILEKENIKIYKGFNQENIKEFLSNSSDEALVITTSAHGGMDNPEVVFAKNMGIDVMSHGEAVGYFMSGKIFERNDMEGISVAGSHGKTTITAWVASALSQLELDPSYSIGTSSVFPLGAGGHYGHGKYFVAEADEYAADMKYDKTAKLLYQFPSYAIINNIDFDHPDFYTSIDEVEEVMRMFVKNNVSKKIIVNATDKRLQKIAHDFPSKTITYGDNKNCGFMISDLTLTNAGSTFTVYSKGVLFGNFSIRLKGKHNAYNSLGVIALLAELGFSAKKIQEALVVFQGSKRRIEYIGKTKEGAIIIDDYAHHPKEIEATLAAIDSSYSQKKILCIFQAHTFSRTKALLDEFAASFEKAYELVILPTFTSKRDAGGKDFHDKEFVEKLQANHPNVQFLNDQASVVEYISRIENPSETVIVTMGAGDVYKLIDKLAVIK